MESLCLGKTIVMRRHQWVNVCRYFLHFMWVLMLIFHLDQQVVSKNIQQTTRQLEAISLSHTSMINNNHFQVYDQNQFIYQSNNYLEALRLAKTFKNSKIALGHQIIWDRQMKDAEKLNVKRISQLPRLPRGCEVTSLAMLLQYEGYKVSPMQLASQIKKNHTPYRIIKGQVHYGHPNDGFVGNMYDLRKRGYGVYHRPITTLAHQYTHAVVDLTNAELQDVLYFVSIGHPVWVIHNVYFDFVPHSLWRTWHTPSGKINITYKEHSVVITGYDDQYIYIADPLCRKHKVQRQAFERGWNQMGRQAIALYQSKK
jgi:uncharacterized protein YvpB